MKKNVAGQYASATVVAKADGTPVTSGTTTVYVTGDGGAQATGTVGSGAATHKGNGLWVYAPAQAETNFDQVCFTFVNTNGVNASAEYDTNFPQTGDNFARIGAPVGASISADIAANLARLNALFVIRTNTVAAGGASTITFDAGASATDGMYQDLTVLKVPVSGVPEVRGIKSYVGSTKVATVDAAWAVTPINTDTFYVLAALSYASSTPVLTANGIANEAQFWNNAGNAAPAGSLISILDVANSTRAPASDSAAIKVVTDKFAFTVANKVDANTTHIANTVSAGAAGKVALDLAQAVPTSNSGNTVGDALNAARAQGFGNWVISGTTLRLYAPDGTTVVRTFTLDSATIPTQRV